LNRKRAHILAVKNYVETSVPANFPVCRDPKTVAKAGGTRPSDQYSPSAEELPRGTEAAVANCQLMSLSRVSLPAVASCFIAPLGSMAAS